MLHSLDSSTIKSELIAYDVKIYLGTYYIACFINFSELFEPLDALRNLPHIS